MAQVLAPNLPLDGMRRRVAASAESARRFARSKPAAAGAIAVGSAIALTAGALLLVPGATSASPPAPPPMLVKQVAPEQARIINAALPIDDQANPAAGPFRFSGSAAMRAQALQCLASAVYYEAGNQDVAGARAVAQVVLNRVRHPAFPASICGVVYQGS